MIVYNPLAGGFLSGKYRTLEKLPEGTRFTLGKTGELYRERYWHQTQLQAVETARQHFEPRGQSLVTTAVAGCWPSPASRRPSSARARRSNLMPASRRSIAH